MLRDQEALIDILEAIKLILQYAESLEGTSINCLTANPKDLKPLESRAHSQ